MAKYYKENREICTSDVTNGTPLMLKIFEYCPSQMARLRRHHGFNKDFLIKAFAPLFNSYEMEKFSPGAGKSPSFFFFTANKSFAIKTLKDDELNLLVKKGILQKYCEHIRRNPKSLLCRFYGVFKVKIKFMKPIPIIVMDNIMGTKPEEVTKVYDLKGSTFQRMQMNIKSSLSVLKDNNF